MTDEIFDWIIEAIPDDRLALHVAGFFDLEQWLLAEKLKPTTCTKTAPCWKNAEITKMVRLLEDMDRDDLNLQNDKLKCPLWAAASSRSLDRTMVALDKLLDRRRADGSPTDALIDEAIAEVEPSFADIMAEHDQMGLSQRESFLRLKIQDLRRSEADLADRPYRRCLRIGPALRGVSAKDQKARSPQPKRSASPRR